MSHCRSCRSPKQVTHWIRGVRGSAYLLGCSKMCPKLTLACAVLLLVQHDRESKKCNNWTTSVRVVIRISMRFNIGCMKSVFEKNKEILVPFPHSLSWFLRSLKNSVVIIILFYVYVTCHDIAWSGIVKSMHFKWYNIHLLCFISIAVIILLLNSSTYIWS